MITATVAKKNSRASVDLDLENKVRLTELGKNQALRPVFEAIANSFDAIADVKGSQSKTVTVRILRGTTDRPSLPETGKAIRPVIGFEIEDNGIGFNDTHYGSFQKAYSSLKRKTGGMGCGRFLFLKAFKSIEIESYYTDADANQVKERSFTFDIKSETKICSCFNRKQSKFPGTLLRMQYLKDGYKCPERTDTIARHIIEHNLEQLLASNNVGLILVDEDDGEQDLRQKFATEYAVETKTVDLTISGRKFKVRHFLVKSFSENSSHRLSLCARNRSVVDESLTKYISDLKDPIQHDSGFVYYLGTVSSSYLDEAVSENRATLQLPKDPGLDQTELTQERIAEEISKKVRVFLKSHLDSMQQKKKDRIRDVVSHKAPELRTVAERHPELVEKINIDSSDKEILTVVSGQNYDDRDELKRITLDLMKTAKAGEMIETAKKSLIDRYADANAAQGAVALGQLVCHRRAVLDVLNQLLTADNSLQYQKEEAVHQVIFPLRKTTDHIPPNMANLWVLDERLAFHHYLASDLRIDQLDPIDVAKASGSGKEPDLVVFHHAFATVDPPERPGAITIIEFKRPGRYQYDQEKNPYDQIVEYVNKILDGKAVRRNNQIFTALKNTRFYAYIIADMHPNLVEILDRRGFRPGPGPESMYKYEPGILLSVEAFSYHALLEDARKRNLMFFNSLGMADD